MSEFAHKRQLPSTVYANPPDDPHYSSGPVHTCLYVRARVTGDWDIFLGPLERVRAETGGADQWVLKRRECPRFARVAHQGSTSASLGYPLSVFNKKLYSQPFQVGEDCTGVVDHIDHKLSRSYDILSSILDRPQFSVSVILSTVDIDRILQ